MFHRSLALLCPQRYSHYYSRYLQSPTHRQYIKISTVIHYYTFRLSLVSEGARGRGAHVNASTSGLNSLSLSSFPSSLESRRGLLGWESEDELERRCGVADFLLALPLKWLSVLFRSSDSLVTTQEAEPGGSESC